MITSAYIASARQTRDWNTRCCAAWPHSIVYRVERLRERDSKEGALARECIGPPLAGIVGLKAELALARKSSRDLYLAKCRPRAADTAASLCRLRINAQFRVIARRRALRPLTLARVRAVEFYRAAAAAAMSSSSSRGNADSHCCERPSIIRDRKSLALESFDVPRDRYVAVIAFSEGSPFDIVRAGALSRERVRVSKRALSRARLRLSLLLIHRTALEILIRGCVTYGSTGRFL